MDASTRILRGLVVAEWVVAIASGVAGLWLWDSLPAPLRDYESPLPDPFAEPFSAASLSLIVMLIVLPLAILSSAGVFLLWRRARGFYVVTALLALLCTPALGPAVTPPWAGILYDLATMMQGGVVALLYLSPAARHFGSAPVGEAEPTPGRPRLGRAFLFGGGVFVGVLAALGALLLAAVGFCFAMYRTSERAEAAGRAFGASVTDVACGDAARERLRAASESDFFAGTSFFSGCLSAAESTEGFCREVPAYGAEGAEAWSASRCTEDPDYGDCVTVMELVQEHCSTLQDG